MEGIKFTRKPRLKKPYFIAAWPGMGEVAFKAATYLVQELKASEFAAIDPGDFFYLTGSNIDKGGLSLPELPSGKFYFWKNKSGKNDLIIFISNAQPDLARAEAYCRRLLEMAKIYHAEMVIGFAALPQPIEHLQDPAVWFASTVGELNAGLKKLNLNQLTQGQISGMNGLFLGVAKKEGVKGFCLLAEIPLYTIQIENPKASNLVLEALCRILGIEINFSGLIAQAQVIDNEINKLLDYLKVGSQGQPAPIGEEEIEKIKKSLSQLTRLPISVKEKIEKLFTEAAGDVAKAGELKVELDKWNAYNEYEDRFLDLFKKNKEKGN